MSPVTQGRATSTNSAQPQQHGGGNAHERYE